MRWGEGEGYSRPIVDQCGGGCSALMSRIEYWYCFTGVCTAYMTKLLAIFILLHI